MSWMSRMFMSPAQKSLVNTNDYNETLDPTEVKGEILTGKSGIKDWETLEYMKDAVMHFPEGELTIANVVKSKNQLHAAIPEAQDEEVREFVIQNFLGADALAGYLIQRANRIAEGIHGGAPSVLGQAFGEDS